MKNQLLLFLCLSFVSIIVSATDKQPLLLEGTTDNGLFDLSLYPKRGTATIGDHHKWIIEVKDNTGKFVENALFNLSGGMTAHGHGLPSQPVVTRYLGAGQYLIEGMLFNMAGEWTLSVVIQQGNIGDQKQFDMNLTF